MKCTPSNFRFNSRIQGELVHLYEGYWNMNLELTVKATFNCSEYMLMENEYVYKYMYRPFDTELGLSA